MERSFLEWVVFIVERYWKWFLYGAGMTLLIALIGTVVGFIIGLLIGSIKTIPMDSHRGRTPRWWLLKAAKAILTCYIEVFRGTPMMVQAIVIYYGFQEGFGIDFAPLTAGLIIVSLNTGAYMAEIVRGGIDSIDPGQTEAARAIGMTHWQTMRSIILPQTIRNILPATGNEFIINIKDTSVLNVISVSELYFMSRSVRGIMLRTYETFLVTGVVYLIMTLAVTRILRVLEKKLDGPTSYRMQNTRQTDRTGTQPERSV